MRKYQSLHSAVVYSAELAVQYTVRYVPAGRVTCRI